MFAALSRDAQLMVDSRIRVIGQRLWQFDRMFWAKQRWLEGVQPTGTACARIF
jgi:hypothetical protein